ncbi:YndJ family protein [Catellatospora paridis]|uniref:YndJ family protein n=1 Tax=Catellatospora paridis TaxID=1617086 RepID=UPI0012D45B10|nr:YndJ family protein [Catellatospora paridis]
MALLVNSIIMLGMLVLMPLGLRLVDGPGIARLARWWPVVAVPSAVALWLPRGALATSLCVPYALMTLLLAGLAVTRLAQRRSPASAEVAVLTALAAPTVAASALVAERAGHELFGFSLGILALTVPHLHFAGFGSALIAGLVCRSVDSGAARAAAWCVPVGTLLVLAGYFVDDIAELAGAVVLTTGMWLIAWLTWRDVRARSADRATRTLLAVAAATLAVTMLLALSWALGEATGLPHPTLAWMAATHGLANALAFVLCALVAWRRMGVRA